MSNKETNLKEKFRIALTSTAKVIADDIDIKNKSPENKKTKDISSFEINDLTSPSDFIKLRAETDSAALKKKFSNNQIYRKNLPLNNSSRSLYNIAEKIRSNVRELEGALRRVGANAKFTNREIDVNLIKESLKDLLAIQQRQISIENIQKTVSDYYNIRVSDLLSSKRTRSLARPRQVSMCLSKELTNHSLPEIGDSFGGRDHTTVLHACRRITALREEDADIAEDYTKLIRTLTA